MILITEFLAVLRARIILGSNCSILPLPAVNPKSGSQKKMFNGPDWYVTLPGIHNSNQNLISIITM